MCRTYRPHLTRAARATRDRPALGLRVDSDVSAALYAELDADGSGSIEYRELRKQLRHVPSQPRNGEGDDGEASGTHRAAPVARARGEPHALSAAQVEALRRQVAERQHELHLARRRLVKAQRTARRRSLATIQEARGRERLQHAAALRADQRARVGTQYLASIRRVAVAEEEEVEALSSAFNAQLEWITGGREWFKLFRKVDDDASGRISYRELLRAVRDELRLPAAELADSRLQSLWRALDEDESGFISTGELCNGN